MRRIVLLMVTFATLLVLASSAQAGVVGSGSNTVGSNRWFETDVDFPMFGTLSSPTNVLISTVSSNEPGTMSFVRYSFESTVIQSKTTNWTPGSNVVATHNDTLTFDPSKAPNSGWQEIRVSSNFATPDRRFTTSRLCVFVNNGKPRSDYCGGPTTRGRCGFGSWYVPPTNYSVVTVDSRDCQKAYNNQLHPGDPIHVKFQVDNPNGGYGLLADDVAGSRPLSGHLAANTWLTLTVPNTTSLWMLSVAANNQDGGFVLPITPR